MVLCPFCKRAEQAKAINKLLIIAWSLIVSLSVLCSTSHGQQSKTGITLSLTNAHLTTVFREVQKQSDYRFVYTKDQLKNAEKVSINVKNENIETVLSVCFRNQPVTYVIEEKQIVIQVKEQATSSDTKEVTPLLIDVKGNVLNPQGDPIEGASVRIQETSIGTIANEKGAFFLPHTRPGSVIIVSSVGYEQQAIPLQGRSVITVKLKNNISKLDETLVIAYGNTTRRLSTGSVSKVSEADISKQPVSNPLSAIQGRAAGVYINTQNGLPGGNLVVQIRGKGSINAGTEPLYVIDGVPFNSTPLNSSFSTLTDGAAGATSPLNSINPADIASIEILKDADATAIYGSRAANGVVMITTKRGASGQTKFDADYYTSFSKLANYPKMLNIQQYLQIRHEGFSNDGVTPTLSNAPELLKWDTTASTNWAKYMLGKTAVASNAQVSISGGNANTNFLISGNYRREGSVLRGDQHYSRGGAHFLLHNNSADKKLSLDFSGSYSADNNQLLSSSVTSVFTLAPNTPIYDDAGNFNWVGISSINPDAVLKRKSTSKTNNLISNASVNYLIFPHLKIRASVGYTRTEMDQVMTYPKISFNPNQGSLSYAYFGNNKISSVIAESQAEYSKAIGNGNLSLLAGVSWQQTIQEGNFIYASNYSNEDLLEFMGAAGSLSATNQYTQYKYASLFSRLHYDYKKKYLLNVNARRDGSSRFGPGYQFGNFWSVGAGWIFTEEPFLRNGSIMSYGKLRGSYGITGNDQISDYQYLSTYSTTGSIYQDVAGLAPTRIANANFHWESNRKLEIALEIGLFKNRVLASVAWYRNRSGDQLIDYPLPYMSGPFGHYVANLPALIDNNGFEFEATANIIKTNAVSWSLNGNVTIPRNKLLDYPGLAASSFANTYVVGEDISIKKMLKFTGIDSQTGLPQYADVDGDGIISTPGDYTIVGRTSPYFFGGFGSALTFRGFQFDVFLQFAKQYATGLATIPGTRSNKFEIALQRWQKTGDQTSIAKATVAPSGEYYNLAQSDATFFNASYIRLKNISISYTLPEKIIRRMGLKSCKLYCEAQNLFTWKKQTNLFDPETANTGIAPYKTVAAGIHLTF